MVWSFCFLSVGLVLIGRVEAFAQNGSYLRRGDIGRCFDDGADLYKGDGSLLVLLLFPCCI